MIIRKEKRALKVIGKQTNSKNCIICGMENPYGVKAPFYNMEDGSIATIFKFDFFHQSYPERVHGGMITSMLDELIGRVLWVSDPSTYGVTTSLNIKFRKPVPYNQGIKGRAVMLTNTPRYFIAKGELFDMEGNLLAEAEGKYLKLPADKISNDITIDKEMCYDIADDIKEIDF